MKLHMEVPSIQIQIIIVKNNENCRVLLAKVLFYVHTYQAFKKTYYMQSCVIHAEILVVAP